MTHTGDTLRRSLRALDADAVDRLPGNCADCVFWELGARCPAPRTASIPGWVRIPPPHQARAHKRDWVAQQHHETGAPGTVIEVDDEVVGYALYAPASTFARPGTTVPRASPDALLLATVWVASTERELGIGRRLIRSALEDAIRLDLQAVEAYGDRRFLERSCLLPASWLLHAGFVVSREHPRTPLFRLDVRRAVRWLGSLEHAWEQVLGHLPRPAPAREPASPVVRSDVQPR